MYGVVFKRHEGDWIDSIKKSNVLVVGEIKFAWYPYDAIRFHDCGGTFRHGKPKEYKHVYIPLPLRRILFDRFSGLRDVAVKFN